MHSLMSVFAFSSLESIMPQAAISKLSSLNKQILDGQAVLCLSWVANCKDRFFYDEVHLMPPTF